MSYNVGSIIQMATSQVRDHPIKTFVCHITEHKTLQATRSMLRTIITGHRAYAVYTVLEVVIAVTIVMDFLQVDRHGH